MQTVQQPTTFQQPPPEIDAGATIEGGVSRGLAATLTSSRESLRSAASPSPSLVTNMKTFASLGEGVLMQRKSGDSNLSGPHDVAAAFAYQYFKVLKNQRDSLYKFYNEHSHFSRGVLSATGEVKFEQTTGVSEIQKALKKEHDALPAIERTVLSTVESQNSIAGSVLIQMTGSLYYADRSRRDFTMSIFLTRQPLPSAADYVILNDIFTFTKVTRDVSPRVGNSAAARSVSGASPSTTTTTSNDDLHTASDSIRPSQTPHSSAAGHGVGPNDSVSNGSNVARNSSSEATQAEEQPSATCSPPAQMPMASGVPESVSTLSTGVSQGGQNLVEKVSTTNNDASNSLMDANTYAVQGDQSGVSEQVASVDRPLERNQGHRNPVIDLSAGGVTPGKEKQGQHGEHRSYAGALLHKNGTTNISGSVTSSPYQRTQTQGTTTTFPPPNSPPPASVTPTQQQHVSTPASSNGADQRRNTLQGSVGSEDKSGRRVGQPAALRRAREKTIWVSVIPAEVSDDQLRQAVAERLQTRQLLDVQVVRIERIKGHAHGYIELDTEKAAKALIEAGLRLQGRPVTVAPPMPRSAVVAQYHANNYSGPRRGPTEHGAQQHHAERRSNGGRIEHHPRRFPAISQQASLGDDRNHINNNISNNNNNNHTSDPSDDGWMSASRRRNTRSAAQKPRGGKFTPAYQASSSSSSPGERPNRPPAKGSTKYYKNGAAPAASSNGVGPRPSTTPKVQPVH